MPLISVIVPVYNVEKYIFRCIDSILSQQFSDYELILVDDGSPDKCGKICDEYAEKNDRIKVIHKENGGLASARNAGMKIASGKYYVFCDSDDYVAATWLGAMFACVCDDKHSFIFSGIKNIYASGAATRISAPATGKLVFSRIDFIPLHTSGYIGFACSVLYEADIIRKEQIVFPENVIIEDIPFVLQYIRFMDDIIFCGSSDYCYFHDDRETLSVKYYPHMFRKWKEKYETTLAYIEGNVPHECMAEQQKMLADKYFYLFLRVLDDTFDKRNGENFFCKIIYNVRVVHSDIFQHCIHHADASKENILLMSILKCRLYVPVLIIQKLSKLKRGITT